MTIDVLELHEAAVYPENKTAYFQPRCALCKIGNGNLLWKLALEDCWPSKSSPMASFLSAEE